jgi:biopolymer transport protein ExbD
MSALRCSPRSLTVTLLAVWLASGCALFKGDGGEPAPGASAADEVGRPLSDMELPVSLRTRDSAPTNAHQLEATTEQLRLGGTPVIALTQGKVADADQSNGLIPKLASQLGSGAKSTLALRLQANIPYETLALVLNTAKQAGVQNAAFQVREVGGTEKSGWLNADGYVMSSKADDLPPINTVTAKPWDSFTSKWAAVTEACRSAPTGNCAYADSNFAKGGSLKIELLSSGRGINIDFYRRGLNAAQEKDEEAKRAKDMAKKREDFLQGRIKHDDMVKFLLLGDPSTQALFQFRYQEALSAPSALTGTMAPLCHTERCAVVITADEISPMVRLVSMIGAAFPDGTTSPAFAFEMPWTQKPKANLPEWAEQEIEKKK